jgi:hypothetical protein
MRKKILDRLDGLGEWIRKNEIKTALLIGAAMGARKYLMLTDDAQMLQNISCQPFTSDTSACVSILSAYGILSAGGLSYLFIGTANIFGGFKNLGRMLIHDNLPFCSEEFNRRLADKICDTGQNPGWEISRAMHSFYERQDLEAAIEFARRAIVETVDIYYKNCKGQAVYAPRLVYRIAKPYSKKTAAKIQNVHAIARGTFQYSETTSSIEEVAEAILAKKKLSGHMTIEDVVRGSQILSTTLEAYQRIVCGKIDEADEIMRRNTELEPRITNRCVYGSFLDTLAAIDDEFRERSKSHWETLIDDIIKAPEFDQRFAPMPDSRNEVLEFSDSETKRSMLIVKRSREEGGLSREFHIAQFLFDVLGYKGIVPEALTFKQHGQYYYFIQKRIPGSTIHEIITKGPDAKLLEQFVATLDEYQRVIHRNGRLMERYCFSIQQMDYDSEFTAKFVDRVKAEIPEYNFSSVQENMNVIYNLLRNQREGGCHGDMHGRNSIVYDSKKICIIDPEKIFWGAKILDWVNFILHTKVEQGVDLEKYINMGYEFFKRRGMSSDEYSAAYQCGNVFKASQMAGTVLKYTRSGSISEETGCARFNGYIQSALTSLEILKEILPAKNRGAMQQLIDEYSRIRQLLSI